MTSRRHALLGLLALAAAPTLRAEASAQQAYDAALALLCGQRVHRDPQAAAALLQQAATQGHRGAQGLLGWMALSGTGMRRDPALAARWLRPAAEAGDSAAANNLGVLYALGQGVPRDLAQAERWFRAAAERGAEDGERNLRELLRPAGSSAAAPARPAAAPTPLHPALAAAGCRARST